VTQSSSKGARLPLAANGQARPDTPEQPPSTARPKLPSRRLLVVDDNADSLESTAMLLGLMGHEVTTAVDGLEAVRVADSFRPDVILMDIGLPKLDGHAATRRIREQPWGKAIVIVAVTGWGQESDRALSRAAGCDAHLVKPIEITDLDEILANPGHVRFGGPSV
jgi:CheY-like chemotaxis protein